LKSRFPAIDVILMTGSVDDLDEKLIRAIRSPAFYFIQKPFDREVLRTLVERCVELRWRREEHRQNLKRLETEMAEARAFQQSLLPPPEAWLSVWRSIPGTRRARTSAAISTITLTRLAGAPPC
jgi:Response regulator containing CheY-like receiver, AAA-type ATPase, and DNA-binding domains